MPYTLLADLVLIAHVFYVLFIVGSLAIILLGSAIGWTWVKNFWFRAIHLAAICVVVMLSWLEIICPLTILETHYRSQAGQVTYQQTFIAHWLQYILYYEAPMWLFSVCYTLFGLAVLATWIFISPRIPWKRSSRKKG